MQTIKTTKFQDVYIMRSVISRGVMGNVYKVIHRHNELVYAAKKILKSKIRDYDAKKLQMKGETLLKMEHPNIVNNLEIYDNPEAVFLVMEYVKGVDLMDWLIKLEGRDEGRISGTFKTMLDAVEFTHSRGLVHGYLQPSSIMVSDYEGNPTLKITSFHRSLFAQISDDDPYRAPQESFQSPLDFWSLGVLLYMMLTGTNPFQNRDFSKISDDNQMFPWELWKYISCCSKNLLKNLLTLSAKERYSFQDIKNHPWLDNIGNLKSEHPELKNNLYRLNFNIRAMRAMTVTNSYL